MTYPGGKGLLFRQLINLMPKHSTYIEPFLGMGAVMRKKAPANRSIGVELDQRVLKGWRGDEIPNLELIQGDGMDFLRKFEFKGSEFVYADPPYVQSTRRAQRVYRCEFTDADHEAMLEVLKRLPCKVMLSGYANQIYADHLRGWTATEFTTGSHGLARTETVWINYTSPSVPCDFKWVGSSFRERQRIQRKQLRMRDKIAHLPPVEREMLIHWLNNEFGGVSGPNAISIPVLSQEM